jgi:hypothetical protein
MYYSSDEEQYGGFVDRYFSLPSPHHDQGGGGDVADDVEMDDEHLLNKDSPRDYEGAPIPKQYMEIPLGPPLDKLVSIKIRRTPFVRQEVS